MHIDNLVSKRGQVQLRRSHDVPPVNLSVVLPRHPWGPPANSVDASVVETVVRVAKAYFPTLKAFCSAAQGCPTKEGYPGLRPSGNVNPVGVPQPVRPDYSRLSRVCRASASHGASALAGTSPGFSRSVASTES